MTAIFRGADGAYYWAGDLVKAAPWTEALYPGQILRVLGRARTRTGHCVRVAHNGAISTGPAESFTKVNP